MTDLTKSTEDYLETIYNLDNNDLGTNIKDIATYLNVSLPAVTSAMKSLSEKDLVVYKSYGPVKLTEKGVDIALQIIHRHIVLRDFLHDFLKLNENDADMEACAMEHSVKPETITKLTKLMSKIKKDEHFKDLFRDDKNLNLSDVKIGKSGTIVKVTGDSAVKRRISEMGLTPGTKFEIIRKAPLGDPIEIKIRGFLLSLRHNEANHILVETSNLNN